MGLIPDLGRYPGEGNGTHSSTLVWEIPWTEEPGGLQSMGSQRVCRDWATKASRVCYVYGYTLLINPDFFLKRGKSSQNLILEDIKRRRQRLLPRASGSSLQPRSKCWVRQLQHEDPSFQKNRERASNPCRPLEKLQQKSSICRSQQKNNAARRNCSSSYKAHNLFAEIFEGRVYQTLSFTISHLNRSWCWLLCWRNHNFPNSRSTLQHKDFMPADESNSDHQQSHSRPYFKCKYPDSYKWALWPLFTCLPTLICTLCFFMHLRKTRTEKVIH